MNEWMYNYSKKNTADGPHLLYILTSKEHAAYVRNIVPSFDKSATAEHNLLENHALVLGHVEVVDWERLVIKRRVKVVLYIDEQKNATSVKTEDWNWTQSSSDFFPIF